MIGKIGNDTKMLNRGPLIGLFDNIDVNFLK